MIPVLLAACSGTVEPTPAPLSGTWEVDVYGVIAGTVDAGAIVTTDPLGYEAVAADGTFRIERLPAGDYVVYAALDGATGSAPASVVEGGEATVAIELVDPPEVHGLLYVAVLGPDELPRAGATVTAGSASAVTGDDGTVVLSGLGGEVVDVLVEDAALWSRSVRDLEVPAAGAARVAVTLSGRPHDEAEYVGAAVCTFCHDDHGTEHGDAVRDEAFPALFDGATSVDLGGPVAVLLPGPQVQLTDAVGTVKTYAVSSFLGGNHAVPLTSDTPLPIAFAAGRSDRVGSPDGDDRVDPFEVDRWFDSSGVFLASPASTASDACLGCHTTASEDAVTCERCHGPGETHRSSPLADKPFTITNPAHLDADRADEVCGQCHADLESGGHPWPDAAFRPGMALYDHAASTATLWASGAASGPHQQLDELTHFGGCASCHDPHAGGTRLDAESNDLCSSCHLPLTFDDSHHARRAHSVHVLYDPEGPGQGGRCIACHMPPTASDAGFSAWSGAGTLSSHLFSARPPQDALDVFGAADVLAPGDFPIHGCADCHAYNAAIWSAFPGPHGDPSLRVTHEEHQLAFEEKYP